MEEILKKMIDAAVAKAVTAAMAEYERVNVKREPNPKRTAKGLRELADYLGRSVPSVNRWKASGMLDGTFKQIQRTVVFDLDLIDKKFTR